MQNHLSISLLRKHAPARLALVTAVTIGSAALFPAVSSAAEDPEQYAQGRILVAPQAGLPGAEFNRIIKMHGGNSARKLNGINVYVVDMPPGREKALQQALQRNPHMKFAELDGVLKMQMTPSDTYSSAWHLPKIQAPAAWDSANGTGITIAVLDGGVQSSHPDLAAHIVPGWNFYNNNNNTADINGHGTQVAGVAAAIGNNSLGVTGGAWNAKIMPMRISDDAGYITYYSIVANALTWAADRGARVANISYIVSHVPTIQTAAQYMRSKGGVVVASAGNSGSYRSDPANSAMITVAATDSSDKRASWSAYGPIVDVAAPGVSIKTTLRGGGYGSVSGTSFSSPLTAGVVALMLSANPALQPSQVDSILASTADDLGAAGRDDYYGAGRINAARAVAAAKAAAGGSGDTQSPTVNISSPTAGATVKGIVTVGVGATDNIGVTRVELYAGSTLVASDTASPFSFSWNTASRPDGATSLVAKAYDAKGNVGSKTVSVTVANATTSGTPTTDTTGPVVSALNPLPGTTVSGTLYVKGSATDNVGVTRMTVAIDGVHKASGTQSVIYQWNTGSIASGTHTIKFVAYDAAGNATTKSYSVTK